MIPQIKGMKKLSQKGSHGRLARLEAAVDKLIEILGGIENGSGVVFKPSKDKKSIRIEAEADEGDQSGLPPGYYDNQVLKWDALAQKWVPGWVTAVDGKSVNDLSDLGEGDFDNSPDAGIEIG